MKGWVVIAAVVSMAILSSPAFALNFTDSGQADFNLGSLGANATTTADGLTLGNETAQSYYFYGGFISRTFDSTQISYWSSYQANSTKNDSEHSFTATFSASNDSLSWTTFSALPLTARYLRYMLNMSTSNNVTRPVADMVNVTYSNIGPSVSYSSPSDQQNILIPNATLSCSASSVNGMKNISIWFNASSWSANKTEDLTGFSNQTSVNITGLAQGAYKWACVAYDNQSNPAVGANRTFFYLPDTSAPTIPSYNISTPVVQNGSAINISAYANDTNLDKLWANISYPNASTVRFMLTNGGYVSFTAPVAGNYAVTIYANDTSGSVASVSSSFKAAAPSGMNVSVTGKNGTSVVTNVTMYYSGTASKAASYGSAELGQKTLLNTTYDMEVVSYGGNLSITLDGINAASNANRQVIIDKPSVSGFVLVYAVNNTYNITGAKVRIYYKGINFSNEGSIRMQKCADWNFASSSCAGNWTDVTVSSRNSNEDYVEAEVSGFSAYGLIQGSYCGDGVCSSDETVSSCPQDCVCVNGVTRLCSVVRKGSCSVGSETCSAGRWAGCPIPAAEICNMLDDNCDGIVDNVGGGSSVAATRCQCYNSGRTSVEVCNNVDDDCNGQVDDGLQRQCGIETGACSFGTSLCLDGSWGNCSGGVAPSNEICANNVDDDCDDLIDEGCASSEPCALGRIPETGCKCGNMTYVSGYCCSGNFQTEPCQGLPWEIFIVAGVVALAGGIIIQKKSRKKKKEKASWEELEKKYA